jgi:NitT/TauT family transport system substrate-binding protein
VINLAGCGGRETASKTQSGVKTIKIAYLPITHALPLYVENEFPGEDFKNVKIELVKFGSWTELADALNAGKVDGASCL